jgi:hypothetical protein
MDLIREYENALLRGFPEVVQNYMERPTDTALSRTHRRMLYAHTSQIWNEEAKKHPQKTGRAWDNFMHPADLCLATPLNCPALRFPSMSMLMPFREIKTTSMRKAYEKVCVSPAFHSILF